MITKEFYMKTIQKTAIALAASGLFATATYAQTAPAPAPEVSPITANVTVTNDYRYRGMTQTNYKPAIQGGFDYAHESGFYIGNWNSSISWINDGYAGDGGNKPSAPIEMDFYAGVKKEIIGAGFASDLGILKYYYPSTNMSASSCSATSGANRNACNAKPDTTELYAAQNFTFGPLSGFVKVSYSLTNIFGIYDSKGSYYPDLTLNYDTGFEGITLNAHYGYQKVSGTQSSRAIAYNNFSYSDIKLGVTKDFGGGLSGSIAYVSTSQPKTSSTGYLWYVPTANSSGNTSSMGKAGGLISLTKAF
jgi:uncharacterized protein (TIGR02001 family)